jgi:hypothetical protein
MGALKPPQGALADILVTLRERNGCACGADGQDAPGNGAVDPLRFELHAGVGLLPTLGGVFTRTLDRGKNCDEPEREQSQAQDQKHLQPGRKPRELGCEPAFIVLLHAFRTPFGAALSELSEEIEKFGRNILVDRALISRTQSVSDVSRRRLLLRLRSFARFGFGLLIGTAPAIAILVGVEAQNFTPHGRAAPAVPKNRSIRSAELMPAFA